MASISKDVDPSELSVESNGNVSQVELQKENNELRMKIASVSSYNKNIIKHFIGLNNILLNYSTFIQYINYQFLLCLTGRF